MLENFFKDVKPLLGCKKISGGGDGEKAILALLQGPSIFLSDNFASAGKLRRALVLMGKTAEIVSSAVDREEGEANMQPFVENVCKFLSGRLDYLIVLPCSAMVKFDKNALKPFEIVCNQSLDLVKLTQNLASLGYQREELVSQKGQFALRGDILDIFPITEENPVRIEFFDDLVEKIHFFDLEGMKNIKNIEKVAISPCVLVKGEDCIADLSENVFLDQSLNYEKEINLLMQSYQVLSYFDPKNYVTFDQLYQKSKVVFDSLDDVSTQHRISSLPSRNYLTDFLALKNDILAFKKMGMKIVLFAGDERYKQKLQDFCTENMLSWQDFDAKDDFAAGLYISKLDFPYQISFLESKIVCIGSDSLFKHSTTNFSKSKHSVFYLPKLGDFVVHSFHGIGKCIKIERLKIADVEKDYFVIEYKNGGILYLPSEEANTLSAYVGAEQSPKLSSLGGAEFARLKERVRSSVKEMAFSLAKIYKERQQKKGIKFERDEFLEKQFADAFAYQLSADQEKAILDIDGDMENGKVMDRLVCGDVGFGKTEVAMRAIFKCVYNGFQAALLCPTTILSQQHFETLSKRFEGFGVKVQVVNRFKSAREVKQILQDVKDGKIDVLIGTHRLLSNDVSFKRLGLLVLDEEQRFGVEHKEKIKNNFTLVDVLTLSATPIPRTLNMSLSGIRDISVIETPPKDRLPIQTYVTGFDDQLLKDVLLREKARGGISFVIYNRVENIDAFASHIAAMLSECKIGFAHGQMQEAHLEKVIENLYAGKYDILVSTTLIENGVDLAKANTMVVVDADKLGLSTLYQLRGRIGRSDKLSYAYLTYAKDKVLSEQSIKRLEALKEFSTLGSGFKIAMRDLEIRGAGNIFGKQQHGHIAKVGYDMYVKILDEEVKNLKGEKVEGKNDVKLEVAIDAFIDQNYISSSQERIVYYTRISEIESQSDKQNVIESLQDGFGAVPQEIVNLCNLAYLRNLAGRFMIEKIKINNAVSEIYLKKQEQIVDRPLAEKMEAFGGKLVYGSCLKISFNFALRVAKKLEKMLDFLIEATKID